jgi:hypothetical protein
MRLNDVVNIFLVNDVLNVISYELKEPLIIPNLSLPCRRESSNVKNLWIPAFAGMTFLEVALRIEN